MQSPAPSALPAWRLALARLLGWRRLRFTLLAATVMGLLLSTVWQSRTSELMLRVWGLALVLMLVFGLFEQWPARLPRWLARWALQVLAVALAVPLTTAAIWIVSTEPSALPFWREQNRLGGWAVLTLPSLLIVPWVVLAALLRQRETFVREQALAFSLERSELARQALDARMKLLQAQVQPHFLFNTLANVRELVDTGSAQASTVLGHLIDYLRAAVPRLDDGAATVAQELQLVRAYLAVMQMRIPDRLQFSVQADSTALPLPCPPLTLLTLVENAVRHGIDPSEAGGRIDVGVRLQGGRLHLRVADTGVGLQAGGSSLGNSLGTGLSALRERLQLAIGPDVQLRLAEQGPHGLCAEMDWPVKP